MVGGRGRRRRRQQGARVKTKCGGGGLIELTRHLQLVRLLKALQGCLTVSTPNAVDATDVDARLPQPLLHALHCLPWQGLYVGERRSRWLRRGGQRGERGQGESASEDVGGPHGTHAVPVARRTSRRSAGSPGAEPSSTADTVMGRLRLIRADLPRSVRHSGDFPRPLSPRRRVDRDQPIFITPIAQAANRDRSHRQHISQYIFWHQTGDIELPLSQDELQHLGELAYFADGDDAPRWPRLIPAILELDEGQLWALAGMFYVHCLERDARDFVVQLALDIQRGLPRREPEMILAAIHTARMERAAQPAPPELWGK